MLTPPLKVAERIRDAQKEQPADAQKAQQASRAAGEATASTSPRPSCRSLVFPAASGCRSSARRPQRAAASERPAVSPEPRKRMAFRTPDAPQRASKVATIRAGADLGPRLLFGVPTRKATAEPMPPPPCVLRRAEIVRGSNTGA